MKKYLILLLTVLSFSLTGCEETSTEPGGTAVEKMAGTWYVNWAQKDAQGAWKDFKAATVNTYNTAANVSTEMWLKDSYKLGAVKVATDYDARIFQTTGDVTIKGGEILSIIDGKVLEGAATTPSGLPADSIVFFVNVKGGDSYKVAGYRRTGFVEDE